MRNLIIHCMEADTIQEVDDLVNINIEALMKYPVLRVFPRNAYRRIKQLERMKFLNIPVQYLN